MRAHEYHSRVGYKRSPKHTGTCVYSEETHSVHSSSSPLFHTVLIDHTTLAWIWTASGTVGSIAPAGAFGSVVLGMRVAKKTLALLSFDHRPAVVFMVLREMIEGS